MPTSKVDLIVPVMRALMHANAKWGITSVLDLGCGAGLYGALVRQYFDHIQNRVRKNKSEKIDKDFTGLVGVEGFKGFESPNWEHYDEVIRGKIDTYLRKNDTKFDAILILDVLEHLERDEAIDVLKQAYERANKMVIITTPVYMREQWQPDDEWKTDLMEHKCLLTPDLMEPLFKRYRVEVVENAGCWMGVIYNELLTV